MHDIYKAALSQKVVTFAQIISKDTNLVQKSIKLFIGKSYELGTVAY